MIKGFESREVEIQFLSAGISALKTPKSNGFRSFLSMNEFI